MTGREALTIADERLREAISRLSTASPAVFVTLGPDAKEIFDELAAIARELDRRRLELIHRWSGRFLEAGGNIGAEGKKRDEPR